MAKKSNTKEQQRLQENYTGKKKWLKWGPYLSERQWGTVREDYSHNGEAWDYFPFAHARSRTYRWGEDGIAGFSDDHSNLCFAIAMWNGKDPFLKERLFGLSGPEGNHAEDVKELYFYLDSTPTHSYMKHLYKYPQSEFPYADLKATNAARSRQEEEYELLDTGVFDEGKYFDVFTEYAKAGEDDILIKITAHNRADNSSELHLLPTLWFRNLWTFGLIDEKPLIQYLEGGKDFGCAKVTHEKLGEYYFYFTSPDRTLFAENQTNTALLFNHPNKTSLVKDSINDAVVNNDFDHLEKVTEGTKCSPLYHFNLEGGKSVSIELRISPKKLTQPFGKSFSQTFTKRINEADEFYDHILPKNFSKDQRNIQRQAYAGMLWTKQFFNFDLRQWLEGDPGLPPPPQSRWSGRNQHWLTLHNEDIISMPDKWEYPWYAVWDLAFHCVPLARVDMEFAKRQLLLFLKERYMRPNGQIPAYEWAFSDVNPPVHAWGCLQVYRMEKEETGKGDVDFLKKAFQKLLINFTWWVNRKDTNDNNVFEGGFLGLDNIGIFDRSEGVPGGGVLEQADGTAWMAMYCLNMLDMAIEICQTDPSYEFVTNKFAEHFIYIAESINMSGEGWVGSWDEEDGFYYDVLSLPNGHKMPLKVRSLVGLSTFFPVLVLTEERLKNVPNFKRRLTNFRNYRKRTEQYGVIESPLEHGDDILLSLMPKERMLRLLERLLDETEFLSEYGIRSLSKVHETPFVAQIAGQYFGLQYEPAESNTPLFGGNSNWRGPVWFPMNYLLIESLRELHKYYGDEISVPCPIGGKKKADLSEVADEISRRLKLIFEKDEHGKRPAHGRDDLYQNDPHFKDLILFYEYFHGENGRGMGASHQTGWTGLVASI